MRRAIGGRLRTNGRRPATHLDKPPQGRRIMDFTSDPLYDGSRFGCRRKCFSVPEPWGPVTRGFDGVGDGEGKHDEIQRPVGSGDQCGHGEV